MVYTAQLCNDMADRYGSVIMEETVAVPPAVAVASGRKLKLI